MNCSFDERLREAFAEMRTKMATSREIETKIEFAKASIVDEKIRIAIVANQIQRRCQTGDVLTRNPKNRVIYRRVGRALFWESVDTEIKRCEKHVKYYTKRVAILEKRKEHLDKDIAEMEGNIREHLQNRNS